MQSDLTYPRRIVVDDTDPRISYEGGPWTLDVGSFDDIGGWGAPYNHTSHGTNQNGASFSFTFQGEFVQVRGIKDNRFSNPNGRAISDNVTTLAKWSCQVDGGAMPTIPYWRNYNAITDRVLCEQGRLSHDPHTVTVNVVIDDPSAQMFWVDRIEYTPLPNANLDNMTMKIDGSDSSIQYDNTTGAWLSVGMLGNATAQTGSSVSVRFNGTSASLYGYNAGLENDWQASTGRYYVDNSGDEIFDVEGSKRDPRSGNRSNFLNVLHFTTPNLEPGPHEMVVTFTGVQSGSDPLQWLTVDYIYVTTGENTQLNSSETTMSTLPSRSADSNSSGSSSSKTPIASIVGGVVGGIVGLVLLVFAAFLFLSRRRQAKKNKEAQPFAPGMPYSGNDNRPMNSMVSHSGGDYPSLRSPQANVGSARDLDYNPYDPATHQGLYHGSIYAPSNSLSNIDSAPTSSSLPSQTLADMKSAQREVVAREVAERRHQDSGIRYPQQRRVVDVPPKYTEQ
ncbi:hypothetical protein VNI00_005423 [Paramarasmius palmivorus]|uniref:Epidermal growth factor receptor-like transmembrane-juxtamembrane segment domain-containing protein n=1 Tax=Paramarasmius palmivorus TaxID=297713 RepID=A0AAW0DFT9_9AGAR